MGALLDQKEFRLENPLGRKADRAIEIARSMPPGPARYDAMKRAGLLRRLAALMQEITKREKPVRYGDGSVDLPFDHRGP